MAEIIYSRTDRGDQERETQGEEEKLFKEIGVTVNWGERQMANCESCLSGESPKFERVAVFLCFLCKVYVCAECFSKHEWHSGMKVERKESKGQKEREESERMGKQRERERNKDKGFGNTPKGMRLEAESERKKSREENERYRLTEQSKREKKRRKYINKILNENETERTENFFNSHAVICDRFKVKHELDKDDCWIRGICGLENKRLVVCDRDNSCIKVFKLGSHMLQRYIWFASPPWDVTEMYFTQNSTEWNLMSGSSSDISATDRAKLNKQCLIVTLPRKHRIIFIHLGNKPAKRQKLFKTEKRCYSIQSRDSKIFTVCKEDLDDSFYSVLIIKSTDGDTVRQFSTGLHGYSVPRLAVVSSRIYLTDWQNNTVQCRDIEGQVISEIMIKNSWPEGISVDRDNNVYICTMHHNKVYKLDSDLTRYKSALDQTTAYIEKPWGLCYYRDKLFIGHIMSSSLDNFVTVVRLL